MKILVIIIITGVITMIVVGMRVETCAIKIMRKLLKLTFEFVTRSVGTDSGTVCRVLRMLVNILGQPVLLP